MKQKLLSLVALAGAMFMSASAWAVDPPVEVEPAYTTEWATPEDGGVYFLYNVGADQYLGAGNNWGTHVVTATVSDESLATVYYWDAGIALSGGSADMNVCVGVLPVQLTKTEDGSFYIQHLGSNRADRYLTSEDGNSWIDGNLSRSAKFNIVAVEGGYTIQATNTAEAGTFFGAADPAPEEQPEEGMEVVRNVMNNLTEGQNIIWRFAPTNYVQCMAYEVRLQFYDKIVEAEEEGVSTKDAEAVYNNPNATADEIKAAINALTVAINKQKFETLLAGATDDDPIEATEYVLQNPTFDEGVDGWFITVTGQNLGWQNRTDTNPNTGASINKFIEAWIPSPGVLGDGVVAQTVYGLPAGKYVLELDATACHDPASGDGTDIEGVYVFIQSGESEKRTPVKTIRLGVEHFAVTYVHDGSDELTFGLKVEGTNANWISADNFQIYYYGKTERTLAQAELEQAIKEAENVDTNVPANADDLEALQKGIEDATAVLNSNPDDETALAARDAMKAATDAFNASAKAYQEFDVYFGTGGEFEALLEQVLENEWVELADAMDKYNTELQTKFISNTLTTEEINNSRARVSELITTFLQADKIKEGDDLTLLLVNPDFSVGSTTDPTGWTINSGALTELASATGNIERYHGTFDISQTIKNMPAGVFDITVQGFVRHDNANSTNETIFYAGDTQTSLMTLEDQWSFDPIYVDGGENPYIHDGNYDLTLTTPSGETAYKCNGMAGAYYWFQTPIVDATDFIYTPNDGDNFYTNHIKITLRQAGDLTIGLKSTSTTDWVIWDNFQIKYVGNSLEIYYQMIEDAQEKMMAAVNAENAFVTKAAADQVNALNARVDKMEDLSSADEALALIAEIEAATDYIKAGAAKGTALQDAIDLYNELTGQFSTSDSALPALLSNAQQQKEDPATIESNEAVDEIIASFKKAWGTYVTFDAEDEPDEKYKATYAIFNYNYFHPVKAENSAEGWTVENIGGAYAADWSELEAYNNDTIYIHQTIEGLKPGFYEVNLQGYYRAGYSADYNGEKGDSLKQIQHAYIYATTSLGEMTTPLRNAIDQSEIQEMNLGAGSETAVKNLEGTEMYIPENMEAAATYFENGFYPNSLKVQVGEDGVLELAIRKWSHIDGDWTIFTNWQLFYLGKTGQNFSDELTAVQGVESTNAKAAQIFTLDGRQAARLNRGINIVRMSDGSVHKVMVK
ncbi:MAG: hypothetical protein IJ142_07540 [Bacteroidaceae bacterium]|nr:hypothetical protein [Bacteroidaceae bacterium]MBQ9191438.1 hypothetical protein [Bacteroidaceae bacterium]